MGKEVEVTDQGRRGRWWNGEGSGGHGPRKEMEVKGDRKIERSQAERRSRHERSPRQVLGLGEVEVTE
jgi:hypothetical protein